MPPTPTPAQVARQWFEELWIQKDASTIHRLLTPQSKGHLERGVIVEGPDAFVPVFEALTNAFSGLRVTVDDIVGDERHACVRWSATGRHEGPQLGCAPCGKDVSFRGITWLTVENGRIIEGWDSWNQGALMAELTQA